MPVRRVQRLGRDQRARAQAQLRQERVEGGRGDAEGPQSCGCTSTTSRSPSPQEARVWRAPRRTSASRPWTSIRISVGRTSWARQNSSTVVIWTATVPRGAPFRSYAETEFRYGSPCWWRVTEPGDAPSATSLTVMRPPRPLSCTCRRSVLATAGVGSNAKTRAPHRAIAMA